MTHRAFALDVLACPHCGGRLRLSATLHNPGVIRKLLAHLGMARTGPSPGPARVLIGAARARRTPSCRCRAASFLPIRAVHLPLTAVVCLPRVRLTGGCARSARPEANVRCACASSGGAACRAVQGQRLSMGLMSRSRGLRTRRPPPDGAHVAFAPRLDSLTSHFFRVVWAHPMLDAGCVDCLQTTRLPQSISSDLQNSPS